MMLKIILGVSIAGEPGLALWLQQAQHELTR